MGCMGWDELARNLANACHKEGYISYKEREAISADPDHCKTITICQHIMCEREANPDLFYYHLEQALEPSEELAGRFPFTKNCTISEPISLQQTRTEYSRNFSTLSQSFASHHSFLVARFLNG